MKMILIAVLAAGLLPSAMPMHTVDRGARSAIHAARQAVVRTDAEWTALWEAHAAQRPKPAVDFSKEMVVGVFLGSRPTAGFSVQITRVSEEDGALVVEYRETRPRPDAITAQVLTSPFELVTVPQYGGEVRFKSVP
jgi:PrcB C-terminal